MSTKTATQYPRNVEGYMTMRKLRLNLTALLLGITSSFGTSAQELELTSVLLTDVIKSQGTGSIDLFKDIDASQLEQYRLDNDGALVLGVDVNEAASGTEKASTQAVTLKSVRLTVEFDDGSQLIYDSIDGCCFSETLALLAEDPSTDRQTYYTLLGETGSSRITANNAVQGIFDSTLKITVPEVLYDPAGPQATSADIEIVLLQTNEALGDPEAFYDFSAGFEDLALLNAEDTAFIDSYGAGREEAPIVILTNPPEIIDPLAVTNWNYFPSATSFFVVGYEDLYPNKGDYDFNDLTVGYRVQYGLNADGDVVTIQGLAYLITRGSSYSHDWRLSIDMPAGAAGSLTCTTYPDYRTPTYAQGCSSDNPGTSSGTMDLKIFENTRYLFPDPAGSIFVNSQRLYSEPWNLRFFNGPKSEFRLDLETPVALSDLQGAPFDPYLYVIDTNQSVHLLEVDPSYQDSNGFPFGMLLTTAWKPPLEFTDTATAYPLFTDFVETEGNSSVDWYDTYLQEFIVDIPSAGQWAW